MLTELENWIQSKISFRTRIIPGLISLAVAAVVILFFLLRKKG